MDKQQEKELIKAGLEFLHKILTTIFELEESEDHNKQNDEKSYFK